MEDITLKQGVEMLADGTYDDRLENEPAYKQRAARRFKRKFARAKRRGREQEFYDELIADLQRDDACCVKAPMLATANFDEESPLGMDSDDFFDFLDEILERLPAILDAILTIIRLFSIAAMVVGLLTIGGSEASAQCVGGNCNLSARMPVLRSLTPRVAAPRIVVQNQPAVVRIVERPVVVSTTPIAVQSYTTARRVGVFRRPLRFLPMCGRRGK